MTEKHSPNEAPHAGAGSGVVVQHPSVPEDSPRHALWLMRNGSERTRLGHRLGPARNGMAACKYCGALMVDEDAYAYLARGDESALGAFGRWCPGSGRS